MISKKILHYEIKEKLGEGGMGVVYKAEDTKLHRTVALKFLSTVVTDRPGEQERLIEEARAAAGLHHPNICTIYEINEYEGQTFIVMSYIGGVTLRDRVLSRPVSVDEALRVALQIAQGLGQAHEKGFIHRDIKSANIMIDEASRAFIMDFGLAKKHSEAETSELLSSGGTSSYMSPEQARGEGIDQRTDIWSLGIVLYEMLAGEMPFRGDYEQAVRYSIVNENPKPLSKLRPGVPDEVEAVINKCMQKEPADRYQTVSELVDELKLVIDNRRKGGGRTGKTAAKRSRAISLPIAALVVIIFAYVAYDLVVGERAESDVRIPIAVIDFDNETDEKALDGLSGMLITALEQSRRLSVMTRTRMFDVLKVMGREDIRKIDESLGQELCREAGVGALVIPAIHKFGQKYTIDLKVLDTNRNEYIFTTKREGDGQESIPGMIDEIAKSIRIDLREEPRAVEEETLNITDVTTVSLDAYKHYFEGERLLNKLLFEQAATEFEKATELDSTFALAYYRLAYTHWWSQHQMDSAAEHVHRAMAMIDRIPQKERLLVEALNAGLEDGFEAQMPFLREMQKLFPDDKEMLFGIGDVAFHIGNYDTAGVYFERVLELDPLFERALQHLTWMYHRTNRNDQFYEMAKKWAANAQSWEAYHHAGHASYLTDKRDEAIGYFEKARSLAKKKVNSTLPLIVIYALDNNPDRAISELNNIIDGTSDRKEKAFAMHSLISDILPYFGRYQEALEMVGAEADSALAWNDSTMLLYSELDRASLIFWGWDDIERVMEIVESTETFPDEYKDDRYLQSRWIYSLLAGRIEEGNKFWQQRKKQATDKMTKNLTDSIVLSASGDCHGAAAKLDTARSTLPEEVLSTSRLLAARCFMDAREYGPAAEQMEKITGVKYHPVDNLTIVPASYFYLGKMYEELGQVEKALASYRTLLEIWKNADEDLTMLIEAKNRVAEIEAAGTM